MPWTCQPDSEGPLWWPLLRADHWYDPSTSSAQLAADFLRAHPEHQERDLVLKWWATWRAPEFQVQFSPNAVTEEREPAATLA